MAVCQPHSYSHRYPSGATVHTTNISFPHWGHTAQPPLQDTSTLNHPHPHSAAGPTHRLPNSPSHSAAPNSTAIPCYSPPSAKTTSAITLSSPTTTEPLQPVPPATGWPCFQGGSYTPTPSAAPPHTSAPPTHPWPAHYQVPTQQQPLPTPTQASSAALAPPSPVVTLHPPTTRVDMQGRPLPLSQQEYDPSTDPWCADNH